MNMMRKAAAFRPLVIRSRMFAASATAGSGSLPPTSTVRRGYMAKAAQEPFLNGSSSVYVEEMYRAWCQDPNSVHKVSPGESVRRPAGHIYCLSFSSSCSHGMHSSSLRQQAWIPGKRTSRHRCRDHRSRRELPLLTIRFNRSMITSLSRRSFAHIR